jgi:hypothetical protein
MGKSAQDIWTDESKFVETVILMFRTSFILRPFKKLINKWRGTRVGRLHSGIEYQGCQIFLGPNIPNWEKYTKLPQTKPNGHKLYQMAIKYSKWP